MKPTHLGRKQSIRLPQQKIQSFWVGYNSSAHPFRLGQAHGPSSTCISLLPQGASFPILSITTTKATTGRRHTATVQGSVSTQNRYAFLHPGNSGTVWAGAAWRERGEEYPRQMNRKRGCAQSEDVD